MQEEVIQNIIREPIASYGPPKKAAAPNKKNDIIFKGAFEDYFLHLLRFIYPDADQIFDMEREFIFINNELAEIDIDPERAGGTTRTDLLAKVFLVDGTEKLVVLHIEIQTQTKAAFAKRIFDYYIRLRDKYGEAIASLAVFTGKRGQLRPNLYQSNLLGTELSFKFHTYQIFDHTEDELLAMDNPFALAVVVAQQEALSKKLTDDDRQATRLKILDALKRSGKFSPQQTKEFIRFLKRIIIVKNPQYNSIFDNQVENLTGGPTAMGITETLKMLDMEEGIEIGQARKSHDVVANLITKLGLSNEQAAEVAEVSISFVKKVRKELEAKKIN